MFGFGKDHWAQSKQLFEDQFEPDGDAFLYRRSQKGAPIRVTATERDRFIEEYVGRLRKGTWGIVGGMILATVVFVSWAVTTNAELQDWPMYVSIAAIAGVVIAFTIWAWGAPARELARRTPIGRERSSAEVRRRFLERTTYSQLAAAAFGGAVLPFTLRGQHDVFHGWDRLWLVFGGALIFLSAVQAFRKWRYDRQTERP